MAVDVPGISGLRELGSGTFSVVYGGVQDALGRPVAVKVLHGQLDRAGLASFRSECLAVGPLSHHPNIITVLDANITPGGESYLLMELVPGGSLGDLLQARGPMPLAEVLRVGIALCGALETAHRAGVFHRDVKPENVLVDTGGQPVLADFGVAAAGAPPGSTALAFTAAHAAPEVLIEGLGPTPAADVYSLGSTLYELLAGAPAFPARPEEPALAHYRRIAAEPLPPIHRGDVPGIAVEVIEAAMAKRPEDRPQVLDLSRRLGDVQEQLGQVRTEPIVLAVGGAAAAAEPVLGAAGAVTARPGTLILDRNYVPAAPAPEPVPPVRSKAPLIVGGTTFAAAAIIGLALYFGRPPPPPPPPPPPTTTTPTTEGLIVADLRPTGVRVTANGTGHLEVLWLQPVRGVPERYTILYNVPTGKAATKDVSGSETTGSVDGARPASCVRVAAIFRDPSNGTRSIQGQSELACP